MGLKLVLYLVFFIFQFLQGEISSLVEDLLLNDPLLKEKMNRFLQLQKSDTKRIVHFIMTSHDDPGWLCTFDEYFTGNNC